MALIGSERNLSPSDRVWNDLLRCRPPLRVRSSTVDSDLNDLTPTAARVLFELRGAGARTDLALILSYGAGLGDRWEHVPGQIFCMGFAIVAVGFRSMGG